MIELQKLLLEKNKVEGIPDSLFWHTATPVGSNIRGVTVKAGDTLTLDTYFNAFSVCKWKKYTEIESIDIHLCLSGKGEIILCAIDEIAQQEIELQHVFYDSWDSREVGFISLMLRDLKDFCYLKIRALSDTAIQSGSYSTSCPIKNRVSLSCGICTYKREKELIENLRILKIGLIYNEKSLLYKNLDVYIADNGHTLGDNEEIIDDYIHLYDNPNYGGSAGFTRCMMEACLNKKKYSHIILLDDDAMIKAFVLERVYSFLRFVKSEYKGKMLGGSLISLEQPNIQMEKGALFLQKKTYLRKRGIDLSLAKNVFQNEKEDEINYNGWFFCCIPSQYVRGDNLPLPMFLHRDDQEYGKRNRDGVITLNGICVWHPTNSSAKLRPYMAYYDIRNNFIVSAKYRPKMKSGQMILYLGRFVIGFICYYRYAEALYALKGAEDFYKGFNWFKNMNPEELNHTVMGWKKYDECKIDVAKDLIVRDGKKKSKTIRYFKMIINYFIPAKKKDVIYDMGLSYDSLDFLARKNVYRVDVVTGEGLHYKKSYRQVLKILMAYGKVAKFIRKNHQKVWEQWNKKLPYMESSDFWQHFLKTADFKKGCQEEVEH